MEQTDLYKTSGHWEKFGEHMFTSETPDEKIFAVKPMNCPGCMLYYKSTRHSYREFPL